MRKYLIIGLVCLFATIAIGAELQSFYKQNFAGLNNRVNDKLLKDEESPDLSNFNLEEVGAITERDIFGQYNSSSGILGSNTISGLFKHYTSVGKYFIACAGSNVGLGSGGTFTNITPTTNTVTAGTFWSGKSFNNKFYMFNPSIPMMIYDTTHAYIYPPITSGMPGTNCAYGEIHKNRFWAARSDTFPYRLYWSSLNNAEDWVTTGGYADLPDITQEIKGLMSWGGYLYIFTETNIYILLGSTPNDFSLRKTNSMVGATAPRSIKITDIGICFLSRSGVYAFDGNNSNKISDKINTSISNISKTLIQNACAIYDGNRYWLAITLWGSSYNNEILIYDTLLKDWYIYEGTACNINYFERAYGGTDKGELYGGSSTNNGIVYQLQSASGTESITHSTENDFNVQITNNTVVSNLPSVILKTGQDIHTKLLSHFDGVDGAMTYTAETGQVVTFLNHAQLDTAQKEFGVSSLLLDGIDDYTTLISSTDYDFSDKDFTIDAWVKKSADGANRAIMMRGDVLSTATMEFWFIITATNQLGFRSYWGVGAGDFTTTTSTGTITGTGWHHVAAVRNGNTLTLYIDGVADGTADLTGKTLNTIAQTLYIGHDLSGGYWSGWLDEVRISKGLARWTSNFTPGTVFSSGTLTSQNIQINAAGLTTLDKITWTGYYPTNTKLTFQTRTGVTNDTVYFNGWQAWTSANTVTVNTVTDATVEWFTNSTTNFKISKPTYPQPRNILYYEDEDKVSPNLVSFNTVGAVSKGKFAWTSIALKDLSNYNWLGIWYKSSQTGNSVEFSIGENLATENTVTFNTVQINTWEKAYWYIGGISTTSRDAITKLALTYRGDTAGSVMLGETSAYNFYTSGDVMTSTPNDWIQYRAILGSTDVNQTPELYLVSLIYTPALLVSETTLSSYYYTKPFDFQTPQLNKQFDSIFLECNTTTASTVTPNLCTIYCDYDIDYGTRIGTLAFVPQTTADTVRLIKNFPSSTYGKTMKLKIYNDDLNAKVKIKALEIRYRTEKAQSN